MGTSGNSIEREAASEERGISSFIGGPTTAQALVAQRGREPFHLPPLPYSYDALEPFMDQETLHWHHDVHHRSYVNKLNEALKDVSVQGLTLDEILSRVSRFSKTVRGNGGGHWNHTFFWNIMTDRKEDHEISTEVLHAIEASFGSMDDFKSAFVHAGSELIGSGWVWLVKASTGHLKIVTTANHDSPLMDICDVRGAPVLVCDLWEHAYYLKFKANREEFVRRFFALVNWSRVHTLFVHHYH